MSKYPRRLIEVDLPIRRISEHARREKSIRHGHISTIHIWWARRPLAACRAVICAALWPDPADPLCPQVFRDRAADLMTAFAIGATSNRKLADSCSQESLTQWLTLAKPQNRLDPTNPVHLELLHQALLDFIADFANWDNSTVKEYLETSRALTQAAHEALGGEPGTKPLVVDPFAGGGSIPLEALRVGGDAFASDLNPVAVLLNKVVLEYIPKYGRRLADEVRKWGERVKSEAEKQLTEFYPKDPEGATPITYLWARIIRCEGPGCGAEVPLIRSLWLAKKGTRSVALRMVPNRLQKRMDFEIIENAKTQEVAEGTIRRSSATCPCCGYTTPASNVRRQFVSRKGGADDSRLVAVVIANEKSGRSYRPGTTHDIKIVKNAEATLSEKISNWRGPYNLSPDEELPYLRSIFNIHLLGVDRWRYLFTSRQMLGLTILWQLLRDRVAAISLNNDPDLARACATCMALAIDRVSAQYTSLSWWQPNGEFVVGTFGRQALGIIWDFAEIRPVGGASGDLDGALDWVVRVIEGLVDPQCSIGQVEMASATSHPLPDDSSDLFFTDPPYYDAVPYADLSDFFYVQLKRMLLDIYPDLLMENLTPKENEIVQLAERNQKYAFKTKEYFENNMRQALSEGRRFLKPSGLGVVVFAHKTTAGWEAMLSSLIEAGWVATASWPIDTERAVRIRAQESAALASSIHLVSRPRENVDGTIIHNLVGDWRDVLVELPIRIHEWMPRLAAEGVVGADAIFACLGPALEIFSRYSRVEKASGEQVMLREYLECVWAAVAKEALNMIFEGADATGFEEDARLTAMWLWTLSAGANGNGSSKGETEDEDEEARGTLAKTSGFVLEYDAARKIAQGLGAHLEYLTSLVEVKGETARLLPVSERVRTLFGKDEAQGAAGRRRKRDPQLQLGFMQVLEQSEDEEGWGKTGAPTLGVTTLDRVHQAMLLFAAGRAEAMKRFLVEEGAGNDSRFWRLAQALSALYPAHTDEKRWIDGVLARKKGLGF
jgi:putative DNA methylase